MSTTTVITLSELKRKGLSQKDHEMIAQAECHPDSDCPALTLEQLKKTQKTLLYLTEKRDFLKTTFFTQLCFFHTCIGAYIYFIRPNLITINC